MLRNIGWRLAFAGAPSAGGGQPVAGGETTTESDRITLCSTILGRALRNPLGARIGSISDVIVRLNTIGSYPVVSGLVARIQRQDIFVPWSQVAAMAPNGLRLTSARLSLRHFRRRDGEMLLEHDVLDKQLIDVTGVRVIRVNDLGLAVIQNELCLVAVDISFRALLRRLGLPTSLRVAAAPRTLKELQRLRMGRERHHLATAMPNERFLDWADVEYLATNAPEVRLNVTHAKIAQLHPVEIAHLIDALSFAQGTEIMAALDDETAADTLEEMSRERQTDMLEMLEEERAADILDAMEPDAAANVLADLDSAKAEALLEKMEAEEAADVKELLRYEPNTAGGYMSTDYITLPASILVHEAIALLRATPEPPAWFYYLFIIQPETETLVGLVTAQQLLLADAERPLNEMMDRDVLSIPPDASAEDAARLMAEYNLLALPVVDETRHMLGVITADDAMQVILPEEWKRRLPRFYR